METNNDAASAEPIQQQLDKVYEAEAEGKLEEALQLCDEIIEAEPDLAEVHNLQGIVLEQLGRKQEAVESYEKAVKFDPDFGEAHENLAGLREELESLESKEDVVYVEGRDAYKEDAIYVAKWGALAFGLVFGIIAFIEAILSYTTRNSFWGTDFWHFQFYGTNGIQDLLQYASEYFYPVIILSFAVAVLGSVSNNKPLAFGLAGGLGYAFARWFGYDVIFAWGYFIPNQPSNTYILFLIIFSSATVGAILGASIGVVTKDGRQTGWLAIAGAIGYSIEGMSGRISVALTPRFDLDVLIGNVEPDLTSFLVRSIPVFIFNILIGAIIGALFGGVLGWFAGEEIVDEDDVALIEQSATFDQT
jgi:hypothetical protein